jgi:hypothetical protein
MDSYFRHKKIVKVITEVGQAKDSPFAISPLKDIFGYKGTKTKSQQLIKERLKPEQTSPLCTNDNRQARGWI